MTTLATVPNRASGVLPEQIFLIVGRGIPLTFAMSSKADGIANMSFSTTKEDKLLIGVQEVHLYNNFTVLDMFRLDEKGSTPFGWTVNNAVVDVGNFVTKIVRKVFEVIASVVSKFVN